MDMQLLVPFLDNRLLSVMHSIQLSTASFYEPLTAGPAENRCSAGQSCAVQDFNLYPRDDKRQSHAPFLLSVCGAPNEAILIGENVALLCTLLLLGKQWLGRYCLAHME